MRPTLSGKTLTLLILIPFTISEVEWSQVEVCHVCWIRNLTCQSSQRSLACSKLRSHRQGIMVLSKSTDCGQRFVNLDFPPSCLFTIQEDKSFVHVELRISISWILHIDTIFSGSFVVMILNRKRIYFCPWSICSRIISNHTNIACRISSLDFVGKYSVMAMIRFIQVFFWFRIHPSVGRIRHPIIETKNGTFTL